MIVPSIRAYSKSGSPDSTLKIFSKTPLSAQRRNRFQTENHLPKFGGRSRRGEPVRAIHETPSGNRRLSCQERPGSPFLPGIIGAIRSRRSCSNTRRIKADLHFFSLESDPDFRVNPCLPPGQSVATTRMSTDRSAARLLQPYWVAVTESQKSQRRSAAYCESVKLDRPGESWISQAGASAPAV
jgi:hypothetical protein